MSSHTTRNWIAVASAEHARRGRDHGSASASGLGFMQVGHGKLAPLRRIKPGDRVCYYSPAVTLGGTDKLQSFVSIGVVQPGEPYAFDMGGGFVPYRRDVRYVRADEASIQPLLDRFEFVDDRGHWGAKFRFGLLEVSAHDMHLIAEAMHASLHALALAEAAHATA